MKGINFFFVCLLTISTHSAEAEKAKKQSGIVQTYKNFIDYIKLIRKYYFLKTQCTKSERAHMKKAALSTAAAGTTFLCAVASFLYITRTQPLLKINTNMHESEIKKAFTSAFPMAKSISFVNNSLGDYTVSVDMGNQPINDPQALQTYLDMRAQHPCLKQLQIVMGKRTDMYYVAEGGIMHDSTFFR